jgi:cell division inhibitor SepF
MKQNAGAEDYDEVRPNHGFLAKLRAHFIDRYDYEDDEDDLDEPVGTQAASAPTTAATYTANRRPGTSSSLRLEQSRRTHVVIRRAVQTFDDARRAADGLKSGQQQIVNLEQTSPQMSERIVDFLNGATYALDGSVEKIGEQVYLFTPSSVVVDVEERAAPNSRASFLER